MSESWNRNERRKSKTWVTPKQLCKEFPFLSPASLEKQRQRGKGFTASYAPTGKPIYCLEECHNTIEKGRANNTVSGRTRFSEFREKQRADAPRVPPRIGPSVDGEIPDWMTDAFQSLPEKICGVPAMEIVQGMSLYEHADGTISVTDLQLKEWLIGGSGVESGAEER